MTLTRVPVAAMARARALILGRLSRALPALERPICQAHTCETLRLVRAARHPALTFAVPCRHMA